MINDSRELVKYLIERAKAQLKEARTNKVEVDVSGGIDSAVTLILAVKTVGAENVIAVHTAIYSNPDCLKRARLVCDKFGVKLIELDVTEEFNSLKNRIKFEFDRHGLKFNESPLRDGAFRSTMRAPIGRAVNRYFGDGLRWGTGNLDEDEYLRFYQKGGDGEVDNNWLEGLYKGDVYRLAEYLGVPKEIIDAIPSPDLWGIGDSHNDEDELYKTTGLRLTYSIPHKRKEMGTIEWVSRQRRQKLEKGVDVFILEKRQLKDLNYSEEEALLIMAVAKFEKQTRHKAFLPPGTSFKELFEKGLVA